MILDGILEFSDAHSLTSKSSGTDTDGAAYIDLTGGNAGKDGWGSTKAEAIEGKGLVFTAQVGGTTAVDSTGAATIAVQLMAHSSTSSFASGTVIAEVVIPVDAAVGTKRSIGVAGIKLATTDRYIGVNYKIRGGTKIVSATIECFLSLDSDTQQ